MNTSGWQFVRWAIPGALLILALSGFHILAEVVAGRPFGDLLFSQQNRLSFVEGVVIIASGLPIGFIVYQIYYWQHSRGRLFRTVTADFAVGVLRPVQRDRVLSFAKTATGQDLEDDFFEERTRWARPWILHRLGFMVLDDDGKQWSRRERKKALRLYQERQLRAWALIRAFVAMQDPRRTGAHSEHASLMDVYHALGAARMAIFLAWLTFLGYRVFYWWRFHLLPGGGVRFGSSALLITGIAASLWVMLHINRGRTLELASKTLTYSIRLAIAEQSGRGEPED